MALAFHLASHCLQEPGRRGPRDPRPPTPPYVRFRIRRFLTGPCSCTPQCPPSYWRPTLPRGFCPLLPVLGPRKRHLPRTIGKSVQLGMSGSVLHWVVSPTNMTSADFCIPIPTPYDVGSPMAGQVDRPPRVRHATFTLMPAAYTHPRSVQLSGFRDNCLLTPRISLICDFCSSGQRFACGFLQIPPHDGHPCRPANSSRCRACRGLAPPSHQSSTMLDRMALTRHVPCLAQNKKGGE